MFFLIQPLIVSRVHVVSLRFVIACIWAQCSLAPFVPAQTFCYLCIFRVPRFSLTVARRAREEFLWAKSCDRIRSGFTSRHVLFLQVTVVSDHILRHGHVWQPVRKEKMVCDRCRRQVSSFCVTSGHVCRFCKGALRLVKARPFFPWRACQWDCLPWVLVCLEGVSKELHESGEEEKKGWDKEGWENEGRKKGLMTEYLVFQVSKHMTYPSVVC